MKPVEPVENDPLDFAVGAHTALDGGLLIFWWLPRLSLPELSAGMGFLLADFRKRGLQIRDTPNAVTLARVSREGKEMIYDARLAHKKIRPETVDLILLEEGVPWGCYVRSIGALYLIAKNPSQRGKIMRSLRRFGEMGVLAEGVIRQRAAVHFMGREEFLMGLPTGLKERK